MPGIPLQQSIVYGPVLSRRLGRSLGVNILPQDRKVCSFNCVYCEYGETAELTLMPNLQSLPSVDEVLAEVEKAVKKPRTIETITFSGNGEPTLHPDFLEIVIGVKALREKYRPDACIALLSNSSMVQDPRIAAALGLIDMPVMKLDAGDENTFQAINRPVMGVGYEGIFDALSGVHGMTIQSMLIDGEIANVQGAAYENWAGALAVLNPFQVQIYSTDRPTAQTDVRPVSPMKLGEIAEDLQRRFGLNANAFWRE